MLLAEWQNLSGRYTDVHCTIPSTFMSFSKFSYAVVKKYL